MRETNLQDGADALTRLWQRLSIRIVGRPWALSRALFYLDRDLSPGGCRISAVRCQRLDQLSWVNAQAVIFHTIATRGKFDPKLTALVKIAASDSESVVTMNVGEYSTRQMTMNGFIPISPKSVPAMDQYNALCAAVQQVLR